MKKLKILITCLLLQAACFLKSTHHEDWLRQRYSECLKNKTNNHLDKNTIKSDLQKLQNDISEYRAKNKQQYVNYLCDSLRLSTVAAGFAVMAKIQPRDATFLKPILAVLSAAYFLRCAPRLGFVAAYNLTHDDVSLDSLRDALDKDINDLK